MAIVTNITRTVPVPHEPGCEFVLRTLTWKQLEQARKIQSDAQREVIKSFGAEFVKVLSDTDEEAADRARTRLKEFRYEVGQFDVETLLKFGVSAWRGDGYDGVPVHDGLMDLDGPTADWAAEQIIAISRPRTEAEQKNS